MRYAVPTRREEPGGRSECNMAGQGGCVCKFECFGKRLFGLSTPVAGVGGLSVPACRL
jgi:hypothetical protein